MLQLSIRILNFAILMHAFHCQTLILSNSFRQINGYDLYGTVTRLATPYLTYAYHDSLACLSLCAQNSTCQIVSFKLLSNTNVCQLFSSFNFLVQSNSTTLYQIQINGFVRNISFHLWKQSSLYMDYWFQATIFVWKQSQKNHNLNISTQFSILF